MQEIKNMYIYKNILVVVSFGNAEIRERLALIVFLKWIDYSS